MRRTIAIFFVGALVTIGLAQERGPIVILSDADFTPENGVIAGTGTPQDPYLIVGWGIRVPTGQPFGVRIEGTSVSFVVRGCTVTGAMHPQGAAIYLANVSGGTVEDCIVRDSLNGILLQDSQDLMVRDLFLGVRGVGLRVVGTRREHFRHAIEPSATVNGNAIRYYYGVTGQELSGITAGHITLAACRDVTMRGAKVDQGDGITVAFCEDVRIEGADLSRTRSHGILIFSSPHTIVTGCERIANSAQAGVAVVLSDRVTIENCGIYANQVGVYVNASDHVVICGNAFAANPLGVRVTGGARETLIQDGLFYQNRHGIEIEAAVGPIVERCAFTESDLAVFVGKAVTHPRVLYSSMVQVSYGISIFASHGVFERNLIARANIGIIFEEAYKEAFPTGNILRENVLYNCADGLYLGTDTSGNTLYENVIWNCRRAARDLGKNEWVRYGRGNWYSDYAGKDENKDGIGDAPVLFGGGGQDPAPLMDRTFYPGLPGVAGSMEERKVTVEDASGQRLALTVRVADQAHERFIGFQGMPIELGQGLAMLFVFEKPTPSQFHMKNVFLPLDIVFWGEGGEYLGRNRMEADSKDLYGAASLFTMALEIPAGTLDAAGLKAPLRLILNP